MLPGNAMIRSSRYDMDDRIRYSYVEPDGETYDISDIVEAEWRGEAGLYRERNDVARDDLLHGVLSRGKDGLGAKLDRVLSKMKHEKISSRPPVSQSAFDDTVETTNSASPSLYSTAEGPSTSRAATPNATALNARSTTPTSSSASASQRATSPMSHPSSYRTASPGGSEGTSRTHSNTPSSQQKGPRQVHDRQRSLASVMSESSLYRSISPQDARTPQPVVTEDKPRLVLPKDDFGFSQMLAIIESRAMLSQKPELPPLDPVDELLFGREVDLDSLHPQIRDIYASTFKELEEMDNVSLCR